ncbi:MAG: putative uridylyltransferase [Candidatus Anoxychlamydiales bacterium]|nr:putative uridylyltransferase [Candidatus Anoxychlamydiales bacterium]
MLKKLFKKLKKNELDEIIKKASIENKKSFLLCWNRGLGDIATGLYTIVYKIKKVIKDAKITFIVREDLLDGVSLLEDIEVIKSPFWRRNVPFDAYHTLKELKLDPKSFDVIIPNLDPTKWNVLERGKVIPKLKWDNKNDVLSNNFNLPNDKIIIGVQPSCETKYGYWRNWPKDKWQNFFNILDKDIFVLLFGKEKKPFFKGNNIIDLRGKTTLYEMLSIIKNKCQYLIVPDSGILTFIYYLDIDFPLKVISLWGDSNHGILKQRVKSPNKKLVHIPKIYEGHKLHQLKTLDLLRYIYPQDLKHKLIKYNQTKLINSIGNLSISKKINLLKDTFSITYDFSIDEEEIKPTYEPLLDCEYPTIEDFKVGKEIIKKNEAACIVMSAGMGSRLNFHKSKGLFEINNKSLFEIFFDKVKKIQKKYNVKLYISIMTSFNNDREIKSFLKEKKYFDLSFDQIDFFMQDSAAFLDENFQWILVDDKIQLGPDGNGSIFKSFYNSSIYLKYKDKNIKYLNITPIDNPLANPFDENALGNIKRTFSDVLLRSILKENNNKKMGVLCEVDGKINICEYIYINNFLEYKFLNAGLYTVTFDFIKKAHDKKLKYHLAKKRVVNDAYGYKLEKFIFDNFKYANKVSALLGKREDIFAPLKDINSLKDIEKYLLLEKPTINC